MPRQVERDSEVPHFGLSLSKDMLSRLRTQFVIDAEKAEILPFKNVQTNMFFETPSLMLGMSSWVDCSPTVMLDMHYSVVFDNFSGIELWVKAPDNRTKPSIVVCVLSCQWYPIRVFLSTKNTPVLQNVPASSQACFSLTGRSPLHTLMFGVDRQSLKDMVWLIVFESTHMQSHQSLCLGLFAFHGVTVHV